MAIHDPNPIQPPAQSPLDDPAALIEIAATQIAQRQDRLADLQLDLRNAAIALPETVLLKIIDRLLDNACKFSAAGTPIQISSSLTAQGFLIQITDYGQGMTPVQIAQKEAYMQFNRRSQEQHGVGLGLIIVQHLVKLHGGTLNIHSVPGERTTVQVFCPVLEGSDNLLHPFGECYSEGHGVENSSF
jgi:two-component system, sensor histidine kinase and response regulator